jgi:transcriptional regulator with XRE-family HTH domain
MNITDKIRDVRVQKNLSQEYMASFLGIDTSSYHRMERGVSPISIQRLELIAQAFEMSLKDFFTVLEGGNPEPHSQHYISHLEEEVRYLRAQLNNYIHQLVHNSNESARPINRINESLRISRS